MAVLRLDSHPRLCGHGLSSAKFGLRGRQPLSIAVDLTGCSSPRCGSNQEFSSLWFRLFSGDSCLSKARTRFPSDFASFSRNGVFCVAFSGLLSIRALFILHILHCLETAASMAFRELVGSRAWVPDDSDLFSFLIIPI